MLVCLCHSAIKPTKMLVSGGTVEILRHCVEFFGVLQTMATESETKRCWTGVTTEVTTTQNKKDIGGHGRYGFSCSDT